MSDIKNPTLLWVKGVLFLFVGSLSATLVILETPSLRVAALLAIAIWAFCRSYYFAFYVIEKYVDSSYRFAGLLSFARYVANRKAGGEVN